MFNSLRAIAATLAIAFVATTAFADVTVKVRQTVGGQSIDNTTYIKGKRERTEQDLGGMKTVTIKQCDLKRSVQLNPMTKMYIINSWAQDDTMTTTSTSTVRNSAGTTTTEVRKGGVVTVTSSVRDTGERKQFFGFTARHIISTIQMESSADSCNGEKKMKMETDGWYIDAEFAFDCGDNSQYQMPSTRERPQAGCKDRYVVKGSSAGKTGYAVYEKMTMFDESGKPSFSTIKEVLNLSYATLDQSLFEIPADYREAKDMQEMFTGGGMFGGMNRKMDPEDEDRPSTPPSNNKSGTEEKAAAVVGDIKPANQAGTKEDGVIRIGLAGVKPGSVGDGMNPQTLAGAIQTSFDQYFRGTGIEIVLIEAKLPSAIEQEARDADCDFVLFAQITHKRSGGGFGGLRSIGNVIGGAIPIGGGVAGQVATEAARQTIYTASDAAASIKAKDELTLDVNLKKTDGSAALTRQFKSKAKSEREDVISPLVEQTTQAIVDFVKK